MAARAMGTTLAAILTGPGQVELRRRELRRLRQGEVMLESLKAIISSTDRDRYRGDIPFQEPYWLGRGGFEGTVAKVAAGGHLRKGQRVAGWVSSDWEFGCIAESAIVEERYCFPVPSAGNQPPVPKVARWRRLYPWACFAEPYMRAMWAAFRTSPPSGPLAREPHPRLDPPRRPRFIAILGTGILSLAAAEISFLERPEEVIVIGERRAGLERARRCGAQVSDLSEHREPGGGLNELSVIEEVRGRTPDGRGVDVVYDGGGLLQGARLAAGILQATGWQHSLLNFPSEARTAGLPANEDPLRPGMKMVVELLAGGKLDPTALIDRVWPLTSPLEAFENASGPSTCAVIIES